MNICFENYSIRNLYVMIVLIQQKNTENMMSDLYFNEESDCEKNTNNNEVTFFNHFSLRLNRKMYVNESHEKETTEVVVCRYSSK